MSLVYGMFVTEPETTHEIYHLSLDDKATLCGRSTGNMVCTGETSDTEIKIEISAFYSHARFCCLLCKRKAEQ